VIPSTSLQITTYQVVASEHANYLAKKAVPACSSSEASSSSASDSEDDDDKGKAKKKPTKKKKKPVKRKTAGSVLMAVFETKWHRIVLDEAQNIKNRTTKSAKACIDLPGKYRWCLTG
jgi:SNF2 family DNA or RNA helicase